MLLWRDDGLLLCDYYTNGAGGLPDAWDAKLQLTFLDVIGAVSDYDTYFDFGALYSMLYFSVGEKNLGIEVIYYLYFD